MRISKYYSAVPSIGTKEIHHKHMATQQNRLWTWNTSIIQPKIYNIHLAMQTYDSTKEFYTNLNHGKTAH